MFCTQCGYQMGPNDRFCKRCGARPAPVAQQQTSVKLDGSCPNCGAPVKYLPTGSFLCGRCSYVEPVSAVPLRKFTGEEITEIVRKGEFFRQNQMYRQQLDCIYPLLQVMSRDVMYLNDLGQAYMHCENFPGAAWCFNRAEAMNPQYAPTNSNMGTMYFMQGNLADAKRQFQTAIQKYHASPNDYDVAFYSKLCLNVAFCAAKLGHRAEAGQWLDIAERTGAPDATEVRRALGM